MACPRRVSSSAWHGIASHRIALRRGTLRTDMFFSVPSPHPDWYWSCSPFVKQRGTERNVNTKSLCRWGCEEGASRSAVEAANSVTIWLPIDPYRCQLLGRLCSILLSLRESVQLVLDEPKTQSSSPRLRTPGPSTIIAIIVMICVATATIIAPGDEPPSLHARGHDLQPPRRLLTCPACAPCCSPPSSWPRAGPRLYPSGSASRSAPRPRP